MSKIRERNSEREHAMREKDKRNRKMKVDAQNEYIGFQRKKDEEKRIEHFYLLNKEVIRLRQSQAAN